MQNRNEGITLVALIITIVVMLILVAVSVNVIIKSNLIGTAEKTVNKYNKAAEEEGNSGVIEIDGKKYNSIEDYMKEKEGEKEEKLPDIKAGERATANSNYKGATIPKGFTVSGISTEQDVDNGLVIYDIPEGTTPDWTNPDGVKTTYNQFVWIPVEVKSTDTENSIASFYRTAWTANASTGGERTTGLDASYTEPDSTNDTADKTGIAGQITELTKSIYKYGGFYIGRYEAGSTTPRTENSPQTTEFVVQQDKYPYNYVIWGKDMSDVSEGAVYLCNNLYTSTNTNYGAISMLCTGAAWDSMLDFIKDQSHSVTDSTDWGNYNNSETFEITRGSYAVYDTSNYTLGSFNNVGSKYSKMKDTSILLTTGATERNCSKNIYDVAGNCWEWTTESESSSVRVFRGRPLRRRWFWHSSERSLLPSDGQLRLRFFPFCTLCITVGLQAIK